jgi:hypothetical protein
VKEHLLILLIVAAFKLSPNSQRGMLVGLLNLTDTSSPAFALLHHAPHMTIPHPHLLLIMRARCLAPPSDNSNNDNLPRRNMIVAAEAELPASQGSNHDSGRCALQSQDLLDLILSHFRGRRRKSTYVFNSCSNIPKILWRALIYLARADEFMNVKR